MQTDDAPQTLAEAIKRDTLTGRREEGLNPGDKARWQAEEAEKAAAHEAELRRMVDAAFDRAKGQP